MLGESVRDFSEGGRTENWTDAVPPLSVAEIVTDVATVTCPACSWNCVQAMFPGIATLVGTAAAAGFEVLIAIDAPPEGAAAVSCTATNVVSPLKSGFVASVSDTGVGGAELMANVPVVDQAVTAAVVGEASPWNDRTCQNFEPEVSDRTVRAGSFSCGESSTIAENAESLAIWISYPPGCGFGTFVQVSVTGSVRVTPFAGDTGDGGGGRGFVKRTEKVMTFDVTPAMPVPVTAYTRAL